MNCYSGFSKPDCNYQAWKFAPWYKALLKEEIGIFYFSKLLFYLLVIARNEAITSSYSRYVIASFLAITKPYQLSVLKDETGKPPLLKICAFATSLNK